MASRANHHIVAADRVGQPSVRSKVARSRFCPVAKASLRMREPKAIDGEEPTEYRNDIDRREEEQPFTDDKVQTVEILQRYPIVMSSFLRYNCYYSYQASRGKGWLWGTSASVDARQSRRRG